MDKIKALMKKCGLRPELADRLCEGIERHIAERRSALQAEFKQRQAEAKRVCLEEVAAYKVDLARRFQIFCEAKSSYVEQSVARQTANRESAAESTLRDITSMLEGVEPNGELNGALQAENKKLKRQMQKLVAETKRAVSAANRDQALAGKVLEKNRSLEAQLQESRRNGGTLINEGRQGVRPARLDEERRRRPSGEPVTTRATLRENQERSTRRQAPAPAAAGDFSPEGIAATMETDLL